jgi:hypothetical protein
MAGVKMGVAVRLGSAEKPLAAGVGGKVDAIFWATKDLGVRVSFHSGGSKFEQALSNNKRNRLKNQLVLMIWLSLNFKGDFLSLQGVFAGAHVSPFGNDSAKTFG